MAKSLLAFLCLTALYAQPGPATQPHLFPGRVGLTLIAAANNGFAIASDGAQPNADGTISEVKKMFPLGKYGAVVLAGKVSTQDPVTRPVREEFNASRIVELWLNAHPDASFDSARRDLTTLVSQAADRFFSRRHFGAEAGRYRFALLFLSYADGRASLSGLRYFTPPGQGKPMRTEAISSAPRAGEIWIFGMVRTPQELLTGNSAALGKYKADPAVHKFRSSERNQMSAGDVLSAFDVVLQATESSEGRKLDPGSSVVAPPNRLATITLESGFFLGRK